MQWPQKKRKKKNKGQTMLSKALYKKLKIE